MLIKLFNILRDKWRAYRTAKIEKDILEDQHSSLFTILRDKWRRYHYKNTDLDRVEFPKEETSISTEYPIIIHRDKALDLLHEHSKEQFYPTDQSEEDEAIALKDKQKEFAKSKAFEAKLTKPKKDVVTKIFEILAKTPTKQKQIEIAEAKNIKLKQSQSYSISWPCLFAASETEAEKTNPIIHHEAQTSTIRRSAK